MILINKQLDQFKNSNGKIYIENDRDAFPHLFDEVGKQIRSIYISFDDDNENLVVETTINDSKLIKDKVEEYICKRREFIRGEQAKLSNLTRKYEKQLRTMSGIFADRGLDEFTQSDCCRSMTELCTEKNNIGEVAILPIEKLLGEYKKPEYQLFHLTGGFGCNPIGNGKSCFGYFCVDGEQDRFSRYDFIGIANEKTTKIAKELEAAWRKQKSFTSERKGEEME